MVANYLIINYHYIIINNCSLFTITVERRGNISPWEFLERGLEKLL